MTSFDVTQTHRTTCSATACATELREGRVDHRNDPLPPRCGSEEQPEEDCPEESPEVAGVVPLQAYKSRDGEDQHHEHRTTDRDDEGCAGC